LVDPSLADFKSLEDEVKSRVFPDYLWGRGVRSSELGVDPTYASKRIVGPGVSDALFERMPRMLSVDELTVPANSTVAYSKGASESWRSRSSPRLTC
jgi:hypothetical protein